MGGVRGGLEDELGSSAQARAHCAGKTFAGGGGEGDEVGALGKLGIRLSDEGRYISIARAGQVARGWLRLRRDIGEHHAAGQLLPRLL